MAKCGKKRYDELPGRVGFIDVDSLRYALSRVLKKRKKIEEQRIEIMDILDLALEKHKRGKR